MSKSSGMLRVGFIGAGNLAETLISGMIASGAVGASQVLVSDVSESRRSLIKDRLGAGATEDNREVVRSSDVVFLTLKPQVMPDALRGIAPVATGDKVFITPAAGVPLSFVEGILPAGVPVVRIMPNTPCRVLAGAIAVCPGTNASPDRIALAMGLLGKLGRVVPVPEELMDAVTALSGSGPAWVYTVIEALADGGVRVGFPRELALTLAAQTVMGAAKMVLETGEHPARLRDMVTSPGGTTIAGTHALERGGLRSALMDAVVAAFDRARELTPKV
ncbi:MAG TPA: pyrroline-5-carboxylate reductase [Firmicutes bacterium]|nr:pyrroline-5-carboxylate reductase [Bacillota bacterium]